MQRTDLLFHDNVRWLIHSGITIKSGPDKGALYGWKNLKPPFYPFIYSEATGYAISSFSWIYKELRDPVALQAAVDSSKWILKNMTSSHLVAAGKIKRKDFRQKGELSNLFYAFDNGMIMTGLLNLYRITKTPNLLLVAERMAQAIIDRFFDGSKLTALINRKYEPVINISGNVKWSTNSGAYHSRLSIGLLELSRLTNNKLYRHVSNTLCNYAMTLQTPRGEFVTDPKSGVTYPHPHLYACEGLIYAGIYQGNEAFYRVGLKGIMWAMNQINSGSRGLPENTKSELIDQSDSIAQLLRLVILSSKQLEKYVDTPFIEKVIQRLHCRLLDFYTPIGEDQGAMRYKLGLESACSWCTMFSMQALRLWTKRKEKELGTWIDYFI